MISFILVLLFFPNLISCRGPIRPDIREHLGESNLEPYIEDSAEKIPRVSSEEPVFDFEGEKWSFIVPNCDAVDCGSSTPINISDHAKLKKRVEGSEHEFFVPLPAVPWADIEYPPEVLVRRWLHLQYSRYPNRQHTRWYQASPYSTTASLDKTRLFGWIRSNPSNVVPTDIENVIGASFPQISLHYVVSPYLVYMANYLGAVTLRRSSGTQPVTVDPLPTPPLEPGVVASDDLDHNFSKNWTAIIKYTHGSVRRLLNDVTQNTYEGVPRINDLRERLLLKRLAVDLDYSAPFLHDQGETEAEKSIQSLISKKFKNIYSSNIIEQVCRWSSLVDWSFMTRDEARAVHTLLLRFSKSYRSIGGKVTDHFFGAIQELGRHLRDVSWTYRHSVEEFNKISKVMHVLRHAADLSFIALEAAILRQGTNFREPKPDDYRYMPRSGGTGQGNDA